MAENKEILPFDGNYTPLYGYDLSEEVYRVAGLVWDADTLAWVKAKQAVLSTDTVSVDLATTNALVQDVLDKLDDRAYALRLDEVSSTLMYVGEAVPGTATSAASWRIKKIDQTSGTVITWADGNANFDNVWDNHTSLTYS